MRRIFLRTLLIVVCLGVLGVIWIFGGRRIGLVVDRLGSVKIDTRPITELRYEGGPSGGTFRVGDAMLGTTGPDNRSFPLSVVPDANNKLILFISGRSFPLGQLVPASDQETATAFTVRPDPDDESALMVRRSFFSWPTPLDFNFMTGHAPSWKRHRYQQLVWRKHSGARLELLWRFEQYFYPNEGWTDGNMTHEGTTGLLRATIEP